MTATTSRARRRLVVALGGVWGTAPLLLMVARWPAWWTWIAPEQSPMTWLQSVVLVLAAALALRRSLVHHPVVSSAGAVGAPPVPAGPSPAALALRGPT